MNYLVSKPMSLMNALQEIFPESSKSFLRELLKYHRINIDGEVTVKANYILKEGQTIFVEEKSKKLPAGVEIIYKDRHIIIVNKPVHMLSVPLDRGGPELHLLGVLREYFNTTSIYAVHRIDKGTSGIMIFARGRQAVDRLNEMFKSHDLKRGYIAVVEGNLREDSGTWESNLIETEDYNVHKDKSDNPRAKKAITHYSVFHRSKNFSFLRLFLETGRKHQIRVHCKDAGHPIVGDKRYGNKKCNPIYRMCLHASILEFNHPITRLKVSFSAPMPKSFSKLGLKNKDYF